MTFLPRNYLVPVIFPTRRQLVVGSREAHGSKGCLVLSSERLLIVAGSSTGKAPQRRREAVFMTAGCSLWRPLTGPIRVDFYVAYVFSLSNVPGIVFISQLTNTELGSGWFSPPGRNEENRHLNPTPQSLREEIQRSISEQSTEEASKCLRSCSQRNRVETVHRGRAACPVGKVTP